MEPVNGYLEIIGQGYGFLRNIDGNFRPDNMDTFVPAAIIQKHKLYEGVFIEGEGVPGNSRNNNLKLAQIGSVNQLSLEEYGRLASLKERTSIHPEERIRLTLDSEDIMGRAFDMIIPMGKGQRGLIISPPKSGKTTILKHMTQAVLQNHPEMKVFVLLVDERPEEVTDFKRGLDGAHVLASSLDEGVDKHLRITKLTMNTAIRSAETNCDTVVFIDSLTRLARAFNTGSRSNGRTLTGGLGANAMEIPRRVFGAARNLEDGGSLTIVATILVDTGSRMDDIIFQEFRGTGNLDLVLSRKCAEQRLWPAIDIKQSGTRKEHLLFSEEEMSEASNIRRKLASLDEVTALGTFLEKLSETESE